MNISLEATSLPSVPPQTEGDDPQTAGELFGLACRQLRRLAHRARAGRAGDATLGTTVVHEAYLELARARPWDRVHFLAVAAHAMRQALINYAEYKRAGKRDGAPRRTTLDGLAQDADAIDELIAMERALRELERNNPRLGKVVECGFFGGLGIGETAEVTGTSAATRRSNA